MMVKWEPSRQHQPGLEQPEQGRVPLFQPLVMCRCRFLSCCLHRFTLLLFPQLKLGIIRIFPNPNISPYF